MGYATDFFPASAGSGGGGGGGEITPVAATFATVAAMQASTQIANNDIVQTLGYTEKNDGGEMVYVATNVDLSADVDEGSVIALAGGLYAQAQFPTYYRPEMWGAVADNSANSADVNTAAFTAMFNYSRDVKTQIVEMGGGTYYVNESIPFYKPLAGVNLATGYYVVRGNGSKIIATGRRTSSNDTLTIQTGLVSVNVASSAQRFVAGERARIYANSYEHSFMEGEIVSYSGGVIEIDVDTTEFFMRRTWRGNVNLELGVQTVTFKSNGAPYKVGESVTFSSGTWCDAGDIYGCTGNVTSVGSNNITVDITSVSGVYTASVTKTMTLATGNQSINSTGHGLVEGMKVKFAADASNYAIGTIYRVANNNTFYVNFTTIVGSGTYSSWTLSPYGLTNFDCQLNTLTHNSWVVAGGINIFDRSITQEQALSTDTHTISTGSKTFNYSLVSSTFYAVVGRVVYAYYDSSTYVRGTVTAFDSTARSVTINVTSTSGSGTFSQWDLKLDMMWLAERAIAAKVDIGQVSFQGGGLQGLDVGLRMACTYGSRVIGGGFSSLQTGYWGEFNLMCDYADAIFFSCEYGARFDKGNWLGASGSNSQSNVANILNYRQYGGRGSKAGLYIKASNSYWVQNFICEGGAAYCGVLMQRFGSPNVVVATFDDVHIEVTQLHAFYEAIDDSQMNITLNRVYMQYNNVIANTQSELKFHSLYWLTGSGFIMRSDTVTFEGAYNATPSEVCSVDQDPMYWFNGSVPYYVNGAFGLTNNVYTRVGWSFGDPDVRVSAGSGVVRASAYGTNYLQVSSATCYLGRDGSGQFYWNSSSGLAMTTTASGRAMKIEQNPASNAGGIYVNVSLGSTRYNRFSVQRQSTYGAGFTYQYAFPAQAGGDKSVMKLNSGTAGGSNENLAEWDYVNFIELGDLSDTTYTDKAGYAPVVNEAENGIEFAPISEFATLPVQEVTASRDLAAADAQTCIYANSSSAIELTVPVNTFTADQVIQVIQGGTGAVSILAASGVSVLTSTGFAASTASQYALITLKFILSANTVVVYGERATA